MKEKVRTETRPHRKRLHPWAFPLGLAVAALAIVGAITLISLGVNGIKELTDKSAQKAEYESFLTQVVRNDPDPFDDISKANMSQLLEAAIFEFLEASKNSTNTYEYSSVDPVGQIIPQDKIEEKFKKLFGSEVTPVHTTILGNGYTLYYDEAKKSYILPLTGIEPIYTPVVSAIDKKGNSIILTVGYVASGEWHQDERGRLNNPEPEKYMKITLRKPDTESGYYISAIQETEALETADPNQKNKETQKTTTVEADTGLNETSAIAEGETSNETALPESSASSETALPESSVSSETALAISSEAVETPAEPGQ